MDRIAVALHFINEYGDVKGNHHKQWLIDQLVRVLADNYNEWVIKHNTGEHGPDTYSWDEGIAP